MDGRPNQYTPSSQSYSTQSRIPHAGFVDTNLSSVMQQQQQQQQPRQQQQQHNPPGQHHFGMAATPTTAKHHQYLAYTPPPSSRPVRMDNGGSSTNGRKPDLVPEFSLSSNQIWSASYSGVEVIQQIYNGIAVMRRITDSYVNATQILKCAQYDKPHRTRFLERQIHTGTHEKVQGGYGKYQGTWVPLDCAISLAKQLKVYDAIKYVLEYNPKPGEKPPTAPRSLESLRKRKRKVVKGSSAENQVMPVNKQLPMATPASASVPSPDVFQCDAGSGFAEILAHTHQSVSAA
ncbi:Transcription factor mbp1, partial [Spiromyces aspiralis]